MSLTAHYQPLVTRLVRDDASRITEPDRDNAIDLAVERYSQDRPRTLVEDITSDGTRALALPGAWVADFSTLVSLEYPIGQFPPSLLTGFELYQGPSTTVVHLQSAPAASADVRAAFTARHVLSQASDTIPQQHREAVASYAASILCEQLASFYSGEGDSTINADAVDHRSKASEFARRAKTLRTRYYDALGIDPKKNVAAGVVVEVDMPSSTGAGRLTHPERYR